MSAHPDNFKLRRLGIENAVCARHCSVCEGMDHHWMDDFDDTGEPILACKHCDTVKPYPEDDGDSDWDLDADAGCAHCDGSGWRHGCPDDLCRGSNEPEDCDMRMACRHCNADGFR